MSDMRSNLKGTTGRYSVNSPGSYIFPMKWMTTRSGLSSYLSAMSALYVAMLHIPITLLSELICLFLFKRRPPKDTTSSNALLRYEKAISSKYEKQLASFNEEEYRQLEELKDLFEFLDDIIPEDDEEEERPKRGGRKRYVTPLTRLRRWEC